MTTTTITGAGPGSRLGTRAAIQDPADHRSGLTTYSLGLQPQRANPPQHKESSCASARQHRPEPRSGTGAPGPARPWPHGGMWGGGCPCPPGRARGGVCMGRSPCFPGRAPWGIPPRKGRSHPAGPLTAASTPDIRASANHSLKTADGQRRRANPTQGTGPPLMRCESDRSMEPALCPTHRRATNQCQGRERVSGTRAVQSIRTERATSRPVPPGLRARPGRAAVTSCETHSRERSSLQYRQKYSCDSGARISFSPRTRYSTRSDCSSDAILAEGRPPPRHRRRQTSPPSDVTALTRPRDPYRKGRWLPRAAPALRGSPGRLRGRALPAAGRKRSRDFVLH